MRVSFSEENPIKLALKQQRTQINLNILRAKSKQEEEIYQKELRAINKKLGLR